MQSLKLNGDSIANEFYNLVKKASPNYEALDQGLDEALVAASSVDGQKDFFSQLEAGLGGVNKEALSEMIAEAPAEEPVSEAVEMAAAAYDGLGKSSSKESGVISGLEKIANDLRAKGESFAADVVTATASSIQKDIVKESAQKQYMTSSLNKIAKDLYQKGEQLAGDMVVVTINKINS